MKKTDLLFQMLETPDQYSEAQWQDILSDEECREFYALMAQTKSAFQSTHVTDEEIDTEWRRLCSGQRKINGVVPLWRKIAAAAAIVVVFFGITIASVQTNLFGLVQSSDKADNDTTAKYRDESTQVFSDEIDARQTADTIATTQPHLYDNVQLEQILNDVAVHYHVTVEYRSYESRSLRLYYEWQPDYSLDKVLEMLNNFESFSIHRESHKLIVESQEEGKQ